MADKNDKLSELYYDIEMVLVVLNSYVMMPERQE